MGEAVDFFFRDRMPVLSLARLESNWALPILPPASCGFALDLTPAESFARGRVAWGVGVAARVGERLAARNAECAARFAIARNRLLPTAHKQVARAKARGQLVHAAEPRFQNHHFTTKLTSLPPRLVTTSSLTIFLPFSQVAQRLSCLAAAKISESPSPAGTSNLPRTLLLT